tara:strand:- start:136 stop:1467 length:1332 start_codon:yes stop_codon:yes gene_type:complete
MLEGVDYGTRFKDLERGQVGVSSQYSTGFPISPDMLSPIGEVNFALLSIDFVDAEGSIEQLDRARTIIREVDAWYEKMSQGKFKINWRFGDRVFRIASPSSIFGLQNVASVSIPLAAEIIEAADPYFDFSEISMMWTLLPSTITEIGQHFHKPVHPFGMEGNASIYEEGSGALWSDEGPIAGWGGPGMAFERSNTEHWAYYVHEILHSVGGIPDLYLGDNKVGSQPFDFFWSSNPMYDWGMMSHQDGGSRTLIGWHRWLLGWLEENQVYCLPSNLLDSVEITLTPIEREEQGFKAAMIPISDQKLIVVESRRAEGYDVNLGNNAVGYYDDEGIRRRGWQRDYGTSGVIVYTHDTSVHDYNGQTWLQVPEGRIDDKANASCPISICTWADREDPFVLWDPDDDNAVMVETGYDPLLRLGDKVTVEGVTVELVRSGTYDRIRVSK